MVESDEKRDGDKECVINLCPFECGETVRKKTNKRHQLALAERDK